MEVPIKDFIKELAAGNLEKAYADRTITRKSLEAGTLAILESLHRMAIISNELALQEIEEGRINTRVEFLRSLHQQIDKPEIRVLTAASACPPPPASPAPPPWLLSPR